MNSHLNIAVACPVRSVCDHHAKVFASLGRLQGHYLGTRRGVQGIPEEFLHRLPLVGLISYAVARVWPTKGESAKVACFPMFDRWVKSKLPESTAILSSYGYAVESFRKARQSGGFTLLDGGNSHPANFWSIVAEEHARWGSKTDPYPRKWYERGLRSVDLTDWVFSPSNYVTQSFIEKGFPAERILYLPYPVDISNFSPTPAVSTRDSQLRVVCTGGVSLRKGFPYLLEALRIIRKEQNVILMLSGGVHQSMRDLISQYSDVPIDWAPYLNHGQLGNRLKSGDVFALLSVEEGLARTALEAMACGLPVVLTPHTGVSDFVIPGVNGEVVPIRDPQAAAEAIMRCYERRAQCNELEIRSLQQSFSMDTFAERLIEHLRSIDAGGAR
jgi:glycosyltransferase involved in cell wall biosynthesis